MMYVLVLSIVLAAGDPPILEKISEHGSKHGCRTAMDAYEPPDHLVRKAYTLEVYCTFRPGTRI